MLKKACLLYLAVNCFAGSLIAQTQEVRMSPPKVLHITREVLKPGKGTAHEKWEAGWPRAYARAKWQTHYIAASALTGEPRVLFLDGYDSMAHWEKDSQAIEENAALLAQIDVLTEKDAEHLSEVRRTVFIYHPELSYSPDAPVAGMRYLQIVSITVKPGHNDQFTAVRKFILAAHAKAGVGEHYAVYQAAAGASSGLYLIIIPMKSLREADEASARHGKEYQGMLGDEGRKAIADFQSQGLESSETHFFAFSPRMSYPPKDWIDADPDFWAPKPVPARKTKEMKPAVTN